MDIFHHQLKTIPVLVWIILSGYHLIDFLLFFTPVYGSPLQFSHVPLLMWADIGKLNKSQSQSQKANIGFNLARCQRAGVPLRHLLLPEIARS